MQDHSTETEGGALREAVRRRYAEAARRAGEAGSSVEPGPEGGRGCGAGGCGPISTRLYEGADVDGVPADALAASLGCGNPTALADLRPGQVVLDLGSGGGIDVLLSARRVAPGGWAYGLDMTDEMLALARRNQRSAGIRNAEFLKGHIEEVPLPDGWVDVVISNCVINLSTDKPRTLAEAFRVLRPGGRLAVADIVVRGAMPPALRRDMELWAGCLAGALEEMEFRALLERVGFRDVEIEPTRVYRAEEARELLSEAGIEPKTASLEVAGRLMAAFVRARKPAP